MWYCKDKNMRKSISIRYATFFLSIVILAAGVAPVSLAGESTPKNIILFIGDGMGVSHITAGKIANGNLHLERFKVMGLLTTHSQNAFVTDSAAGGTALATGYKTCNGVISVSLDKKTLKTIVEYAEEKGKVTGLVTSCSVTDATPAAFVAHVNDPGKHNTIAEHIAQSGIDVLFGGGWAYFVPESTNGSRRTDEKNLIVELNKRMQVVQFAEDFWKLGDVYSAAVFTSAINPPRAKVRKPQLAELTRKAIEILSKNKKGFFLMVEGSQIDIWGHRNNQGYIIDEMIDFDNAVGVGLDFAEKDFQTLVVVTADHETGGFAIHNGSIKNKEVTKTGFTSEGHTAAMVPVFAYGPGKTLFAGIQDNIIVGKTIIQYLQ